MKNNYYRILEKALPLIIFLSLFSTLSSQDYSVRFDGINDYAYVLDHPDLDLTSNYTLEAWIFPESFSWLAGIISKYHSSGSNGYTLRLNQNSPYTGLGFDELETNNSVLNNNAWYHVAAVKNSNSSNIYVNGLEVNLSGNALNVSSNNDPIRFASDYSGRFFQGRIDEVKIWNIARSEEEIIFTMDSSLTGTENGLVAYYNFNEGSNDTLHDLTNNGHLGTLVGNPLWTDGVTVNGILGDINFDENLNIYDAVQLVAIYLDNSMGNDQQLISSDINQDGIIDIDDIVLLVNWILGTENYQNQGSNDLAYIETPNTLRIKSNGNIAAIAIEFKDDIKFADSIIMPSGWLYKFKMNKLILFSMDGSSLPFEYEINVKNLPSVKLLKSSDWKGNKTVKSESSVKLHEIKTYPNPFNSNFKINITSLFSQNIALDLYDMNGRFVKNLYQGISKSEYNYNFSQSWLSSGIYYIRLTTENNIYKKKIIYLK